MRVLLISHSCQSPTEGQPRAHALAALGDIELKVLVPDRWLDYGKWRGPVVPSHADFDFHVGRARWPWVGPAQCYLHYYPDLRNILLDFKPDVIDLWEEPWGLVSVHACRLRNQYLPGTKIVSETEQNTDKWFPPPFEFFRAYTLRNSDFAVGRSDEAISILHKKGYACPGEVVPNGVDARLFSPLDRQKARGDLNLSGFVVGYVGRLVSEKGLFDLLNAVRLCPPDVNCIFVGSGPLKEALEQRAQLLGMASRVRFLGPRPLDQLPPVMNAMDTLVLPSRTTRHWKEQFGRVLIEANACEIPVIGSSSGAIADVIGKGGLVYPEGSHASLANVIQRLRSSPEFCRILGESGRQQALERYTWERVAERLQGIYQRIVTTAPLKEDRFAVV
jgi:glycosyltransferase involved in cell wall biosynthesis